jgi:hypothetical protein
MYITCEGIGAKGSLTKQTTILQREAYLCWGLLHIPKILVVAQSNGFLQNKTGEN